MRSRTIFGVLFCCAVILPLAYNFAAPPVDTDYRQDSVVTWEHLALQHDGADLGGDLSKQINRLGTERWQLVCVTPIAKEGTTVKTIYHFRRTN